MIIRQLIMTNAVVSQLCNYLVLIESCNFRKSSVHFKKVLSDIYKNSANTHFIVSYNISLYLDTKEAVYYIYRYTQIVYRYTSSINTY